MSNRQAITVTLIGSSDIVVIFGQDLSLNINHAHIHGDLKLSY